MKKKLRLPWLTITRKHVHITEHSKYGLLNENTSWVVWNTLSIIERAAATSTAIPAYESHTLYCRGSITKKLLFGFVFITAV